MLDIRHLEQQWFRYKIKRYLPVIMVLVAVLVITTLALFFFFNQSKIAQNAIQSDTTIPKDTLHTLTPAAMQPTTVSSTQATTTPKKPLTVPANDTVENEPYEVKKLKPSYDFLNKISYETKKELPPPKPKKLPKKPPEPTLQQPQHLNTNIAPAVEQKIDTILKSQTPATEVSKPSASLPKGIKISRIKSQGEIQDIIHRFKANKSPVLGLYLARYYYKMQNYKKAYNYALRTNNIDPNIEESWLIFASSQMKLSKRSQAIKTLKAYIQSSGSLNARSLLHSIQNGEFR